MHRKATRESGLFITLEGIHGAGKSTLRASLGERLREIYPTVVEILDQQGTPIGRELRRINLEFGDKVPNPLTEALLIAAARHENVVEIIKPSLDAGTAVLCERYNDAFFAFQGFGRGLSVSFLECLSGAVAGGLNPDFTILLDVDPRIGLSRIGDERKHRIEKEPVAFHESVRQGYLVQARKHPDRIIVVDAAMPIDVVFQKVWSELENCFSKV